MLFMSSCQVTEPTQNKCSDQVYNGSWKTMNKTFSDLYICDNFLSIGDTSFNVKISRNTLTDDKRKWTILIDEEGLEAPFNRLRTPYSSSVHIDKDTLYMIRTANLKEWIKYVK